MPCSAHIVKTTYPGGRIEWDLHCSGTCKRGECAEVYVYDPEPQDRMTTVKTCACPDETNCLTCPPAGMRPGNRVKSCRIGLRYAFTPDGKPSIPLAPVCVGERECPEGKECSIVVVGETTFDGIHIEILKCHCAASTDHAR